MNALRTILTSSLVAAALVAGCAVDAGDSQPGAADENAERGPIGKADLWGSCATDDGDGDLCGGKSNGNCWCDDACSYFGDCCEDEKVVCDGCPDPNDPKVRYVSEDPQACAAIRFTCDAGEELFIDECGCGCVAGDGPSQCGGLLGLTCAEGDYCDYDNDSCGAGDQTGTCQTRPEACAEIYAPVCGCDGQTYSNECHAHEHGMDVRHEGECDCRDTGCGEGKYCSWCWAQYQCIPEGAVC